MYCRDTNDMKNGDQVIHPIYGRGVLASDPETFDSIQWSGTCAWVCFYNPKTGISANWPYAVPINDLEASCTAETPKA